MNFRGKGANQKRVSALRELRRLLSRSEFPPIEAALKAGAISLLVQCLSFGSPDEQVLRISHILYICCHSFIGLKFSHVHANVFLSIQQVFFHIQNRREGEETADLRSIWCPSSIS